MRCTNCGRRIIRIEGGEMAAYWTHTSRTGLYQTSCDLFATDQPQVIMASMESEHFSWTAFGRTEEEAKKALAKAFTRSAVARGGEAYSAAELEDFYGIEVLPVRLAACFRDGTEVKA